jgi:outer membrane receptor protein involved in Fe transport
MRVKLKASTVAVAGALHAGLVASLAFAQAPAAKPDEQKVEKVEVTGSRIASPNLESVSPITTIDAAAIKVDGLRSVENLLNNLPQVFAAQGANVSNGATGTATVNLRGLGAVRTLVLVNGRRLPAGSPRTFAADLNQIPAPLIKRVEILTGGAGAVYGSDAVSGVVNFIMNDRFEGLQVEANHSFYNHEQHDNTGVADLIRVRGQTNSAQFQLPGDKSSDGKINDFNVVFGSNFANGKGNATVFFNYKKEDALLQSERDFSACSIGNATAAGNSTINGVVFPPGFRCGGSSTSFPGRFINLVTGASTTVLDANGNTRPFNASLDQYNFGPLNYFQRPSERYGFNAFANYNINDTTKLYTEFGFHDDRTVAQIAPSGLFGFDASGANAIRCNNPLLSAAWRTALGCAGGGTAGVAQDFLILRRNVEGGGRQDDIRHTSYRGVIGVKGEFAKVWNYDVYGYEGKVVYQETYKNDFSIARAALALDVVADANGNAVCRSGGNCVPYNIWRLGGVTPAALNYLQTPGFQKGDTQQKVLGATVGADLADYGWKMPGAKNGIGVNFGFEHRTEKLQLDTDTAFSTGDLFGQGGPTIGLGGGYTVKDYFMEARAPILEGVAMADLLSVSGSYRRSEYSTGPKTDTYGLGIEWAPVKDFRLRGSYQEAVRAPNVIELFTAQGLGLFDQVVDPCGPGGTATLAQCQLTGITAANYQSAVINSPAGQYNFLGGGNPNLKPEEAKSQTLGLVWTPFRNFSVAVDYFNIEVEKVIGTAPPGTILNQCLTTGNPLFCSAVKRDRLGTLWATPAGFIQAGNENLGSLTTEGIDVEINYAMKVGGWGGLKFNFNGTYLQENLSEPVKGLGKFDCTGLHGANCGVPTPEWRHKFRTTWETPWNVDLAVTWRHIDAVDQEGTSTNPLLASNVLNRDRNMGQRDYMDLAASWQATKQFTLRGGINNVFDRDPPLSGLVGAGFGNGNTYPQVYDALGRRVFFNATYKF